MDNLSPAEKIAQVPEGMVRCKKCQRELEQTSDNFEPRRGKFRTVCRACRAEEQRQKDIEEFQERVHDMDKASFEMLKGLARSDFAPTNMPHIATLLEKIMEMFGGAEGYARHVMANFLMSAPGSSRRIQILQSMMSLAVKVSESGAARVPLEMLTDEDLDREIAKRAKGLVLYPDKDDQDGRAAS